MYVYEYFDILIVRLIRLTERYHLSILCISCSQIETHCITGDQLLPTITTTSQTVSPPVSFNLSHVGHASHAEPEVLPVQSSGYGASDGGLSYAGRTVETQDLPLSGTSQLAHRDELLQKQDVCFSVLLMLG